MKICFIANDIDSVLNFRRDLLLELKKLGHKVTICVPRKNSKDKTRVGKLGASYKEIQLNRTGINPFKDLKTFIELKTFLKHLKPDLVYCFTAKPIIYGSLAAWWAGVPRRVSMITGLGYVFTGESLKHHLIRFLVCSFFRFSFKFNQKVFFLNPDDLALFLKLNLVRASQAVLIPGEGINHKTFPQTGFPKKTSFLLIARLLKDKGILEYVEAAKILNEKFPEVVFKLLGPYDTNPTAITAKEMRGWQKSGLIKYLGVTDDVRPFIADTSVYVLPSYREGTPRSVLEAMSMGRPIITTDVPGCRETVENGRNGFLIPVRNAQALADAMRQFILRPALAKRMGSQSREIAEKKYDVNKVNHIILNTLLNP